MSAPAPTAQMVSELLRTMHRAQPVPTGIEAQVCTDIAQRQALGVAKYGTTVADNPLELRAWLEHAYQEALDQAIYLRRAMDQIDRAATQEPTQ